MGKSDSTAANSFAGEHGRKIGLSVRYLGGDTLDRKVGVGINQETMGHVHKDVEVGKEISTENEFLDICNNEYPSKSAS